MGWEEIEEGILVLALTAGSRVLVELGAGPWI